MALAYDSIFDSIPSVLTREFLTDFVLPLISHRLNYCPVARSTTYYFSQSGSDDSGDGSITNPWKTLAKCQSVHDSTMVTSDVAFLFKRGDVWRESAGLDITKDSITVGAYGTGDKPLFSVFKYTIEGVEWTASGSGLYTDSITGYTLSNKIGWVRDRENPLNPYAAMNTSAGVTGGQNFSWYHDTTAGRLYIRVDGIQDPPEVLEFSRSTETQDDGIEVKGDGCRIDNIRCDGWGADAYSVGHQYYPIKATPNGTDLVAITNCEGYYSGRHSISQYTTTGDAGGFVIIDHCKCGYTDDTGNTVTNYNAYSASGQHEFILSNSEVAFGILPDTSLPDGGGTDDLTVSNRGVFYGHTASDSYQANLILTYNNTVEAYPEYSRATWMDGNINFAPTQVPQANTIDSIRCWHIGWKCIHNQPVRGSFVHRENNVYINCHWKQTFSNNTFYIDGSAIPNRGYLINCIYDFEDDLARNRSFMYGSASGTHQTKFINCHINGNSTGAPQYWTIAYDFEDSVEAYNTILSRSGTRTFQANIPNDPTHQMGLATFQVQQANGTFFGVDSGYHNVVLDGRLDSPGGVAADSIISFSRPIQADSAYVGFLYQAGVSGDSTGYPLEYDFYWRKRDPQNPSIGPVEYVDYGTLESNLVSVSLGRCITGVIST